MVGGGVDELIVGQPGRNCNGFPFVEGRGQMPPVLDTGHHQIEKELSALEMQAWGPVALCAGRHISGRCNGRTVCRRPGASSSAPGTRCRGDRGVLSVMRQRSWSWRALSPRAGNLVNRMRVDHEATAKNLAALRAFTKNHDIVRTTNMPFIYLPFSQKGS